MDRDQFEVAEGLPGSVLFAQAPVGLALFDQAGRLRAANDALAALLGYRPDQLRGRPGRELLHPDDPGGQLLADPPTGESVAAAGESPLPPRVLARADGQPLLCQLPRAAVTGRDGTRWWLVGCHDVTAQMRHAEALRYQTSHDATTGLLNRTGLDQRLAALRDRHPTATPAVLFCDLDNFHRVNDALGHEAGDQLLAAVAQRLVEALPPDCTPARLYGDEFVILCAQAEARGGPQALTRQVAELFPMRLWHQDRPIHLAASVQASSLDPAQASLDELTRPTRWAPPGSHPIPTPRRQASPSPGPDQLSLENDLREALAHDRLELRYQPIIANDGSVTLAEALLRWTHPEHGPVPPPVVLHVADQGGLLAELDRCVLRTALRESASLQRPDTRPVGIAVNLAGLHPEHPTFADDITTLLDHTGTPPERVVLEMVETQLVELTPKQHQAMSQLVETGLRFAIDDFGTGYSSLARLKHLPAQIIKLDREFVSGLATNTTDLGIARAVTELAHTMGHTCIAEGVEEPAQHHLLHSLNLDAYQGYLFSAPLPAPQFRTYLHHTPLPTP